MLAGWSSGSKYPLLGSVRASAQMVSYEAALGLAVAAVVLVTGTLSHQRHRRPTRHGSFVPTGTSVATGFVPFVVFLIAATAELNRPPFDLVEAEQELVGGFNTEYSLVPLRAVLPGRVHEHDHDVGDHRHPVPRRPRRSRVLGESSLGLATGIVWFFAKLLVFLFIFVWFRATLPRLRYDQLMDLGWKLLIPWRSAGSCCSPPSDIARTQGWNRVVVGDRRRRSWCCVAGYGLLRARRSAVGARRRERRGGAT